MRGLCGCLRGGAWVEPVSLEMREGDGVGLPSEAPPVVLTPSFLPPAHLSTHLQQGGAWQPCGSRCWLWTRGEWRRGTTGQNVASSGEEELSRTVVATSSGETTAQYNGNCGCLGEGEV